MRNSLEPIPSLNKIRKGHKLIIFSFKYRFFIDIKNINEKKLDYCLFCPEQEECNFSLKTESIIREHITYLQNIYLKKLWFIVDQSATNCWLEINPYNRRPGDFVSFKDFKYFFNHKNDTFDTIDHLREWLSPSKTKSENNSARCIYYLGRKRRVKDEDRPKYRENDRSYSCHLRQIEKKENLVLLFEEIPDEQIKRYTIALFNKWPLPVITRTQFEIREFKQVCNQLDSRFKDKEKMFNPFTGSYSVDDYSSDSEEIRKEINCDLMSNTEESNMNIEIIDIASDQEYCPSECLSNTCDTVNTSRNFNRNSSVRSISQDSYDKYYDNYSREELKSLLRSKDSRIYDLERKQVDGDLKLKRIEIDLKYQEDLAVLERNYKERYYNELRNLELTDYSHNTTNDSFNQCDEQNYQDQSREEHKKSKVLNESKERKRHFNDEDSSDD